MLFLWFLILSTCFNFLEAQQFYDKSDCSQNTSFPGTRYICKSNSKTCSTFLVYRTNQNFRTISNVSELFQKDSKELLVLNNLSSSSEILKPDREILIPVKCSCVDKFFQVNFSYIIPDRKNYSEIACQVFEGLVKSSTIFQENPSQVEIGSEINVPLKCACPENYNSDNSSNGIMYLVTYPLKEGDELSIISQKFGISLMDLWRANSFESLPTVYPNTTFLIPLKRYPIIDLVVSNSPPPPPGPGFLPTITVEKKTSTKLKNLYIAVSVVGFCLIISALVAGGWYVKVLCRRKIDKLLSFNTRSSQHSFSTMRSSPRSGQLGSSGTSCLSPDLLAGIKFTLKNYSIDELRMAAQDFNEDAKIGERTYKGLINNVEIMIKQMRLEDTRQVIDIHSKINHINIVNLLGVCYDDDEYLSSYVVFKLPGNGSLRDCLSNSSSSLRWERRTQIAFDIAKGLHYLHYCIFPSYAHMNVNSRSVYLTADWRAKLTHIKTNVSAESISGNHESDNIKRWTAPEYILYGSASDKVDVFAFGVVLLELISGREDADGNSFKDFIGFLGSGANEAEGGCFEQLRSFVDPCLKDDYRLADALCIAVLAKACVEDDPLHRPSTDDILKVLVRLV